jgi:hypothetical protein
MPYAFPISFHLDRSDPSAKTIWVIDPTNAHFYEKSSNMKEKDRIWMDVVDEIKDKLQYCIKCTCQNKKCVCIQDWNVKFYRSKELHLSQFLDENGEMIFDYSKRIEKIAQLGVFKMMMLWFYKEFLKSPKIKGGKPFHFQSEEEQKELVFWIPGELEDLFNNSSSWMDSIQMRNIYCGIWGYPLDYGGDDVGCEDDYVM